jgi:hypothetical protein
MWLWFAWQGKQLVGLIGISRLGSCPRLAGAVFRDSLSSPQVGKLFSQRCDADSIRHDEICVTDAGIAVKSRDGSTFPNFISIEHGGFMRRTISGTARQV